MVQSLTCLILQKKNRLSKIWLAAHWDKRLTRYHILQIDIERCIKDILNQEIILDLRLSGHLLIGIVKIFSRKISYLLHECTDIISRVRAFQPDITDLPLRKLTAPMNLITLPEVFEFHKLEEDGNFNSLQSNAEEITLKETACDTRLIADDEHFDVFGEENIPMDFEENIQLASLLNDVDNKAGHEIQMDGENISDSEHCNGIEAINGSSDSNGSFHENGTARHTSVSQTLISGRQHFSVSRELISICVPNKAQKPKSDDKLNLEPLSNSFNGIQRTRKQKRKLIIDEEKSLTREKIEKQFQEFSNLVAPIDLAPPSKRLMILKEIGSAEQLLHQSGLNILSTKIKNLFKENFRNLKTQEMVIDSDTSEDSALSINLENPRGKLFVDDCAATVGFDEQDFPPNDLNDQHGLSNGDALPEIVMNSDSSNDVGHFNEQRNSFTEDIELSIERQQQDSGCSSNGVSSICQVEIIKLLRKLRKIFEERNEIEFSYLVQTDRKIKVAQKFHSMLMIKKFNIVEIQQAKPYGEIFITKGSNFVVACEDVY